REAPSCANALRQTLRDDRNPVCKLRPNGAPSDRARCFRLALPGAFLLAACGSGASAPSDEAAGGASPSGGGGYGAAGASPGGQSSTGAGGTAPGGASEGGGYPTSSGGVAAAHPNVKGITVWGYIEGSTWLDNSGLMSSAGQQRPAMTWLMGFLNR